MTAVDRLSWSSQRLALAVFRRLPVSARRSVVRAVSPTYTAGSIVLIERDDGDVLLIRQTYRRGWGLPGGLLAKGETPGDAARREVREEVGLDIELLEPARLVMDLVPRRLDFVYRGRLLEASQAERVRPHSPELAEARWFPPHDLPDLQAETTAAWSALADDRVPFVTGVPGSGGRRRR